jgi:hypothetical protein
MAVFELAKFFGANLHGFLDNFVIAPAKTITEGTCDAAKIVPNTEYVRWWVQDHTMEEDIACHLIGYKIAAAVWHPSTPCM